jgi:hypothetical protein
VKSYRLKLAGEKFLPTCVLCHVNRSIGADGQVLLQAIDTASELPWLQEIPAVQILRRVWAEQYVEVNGTLSWREVKDMPSPAELIASPYDPEARYSTKRAVEWIGYKVHLTETCDPATPHLIF